MNARGSLKVYLVLITLISLCLTTEQVLGKYGGGSGTVDYPYLIYTAEQMNTIGLNPGDWSKYFKLMDDIDLSAYTGTSFNIIGVSDNSFRGTFDGNGHKILKFTYYKPGGFYIGIFGAFHGTVKNLGLISPHVDASTSTYGIDYDPSAGEYTGALIGYGAGNISSCYVEGGSVSGNADVGGLAGDFDFGTMSDCYSTCSVSSFYDAGGLVGVNFGTITHCHFTGTVSGKRSQVGGLVSQNLGIISACYSAGNITGPSSGDHYNTGGLVGLNSRDGKIISCYSTANASNRQFVGGLVGVNWGQIYDSYARGNAYGNSWVGGLVGGNANLISNCYSTGRVSGTTWIGGLVGDSQGGTTSNSFWDTQTSGRTYSKGGTGRTTIQMKAKSTFTLAGWDFTTPIWVMWDGHEYPWLAWEREPVMVEGISIVDRERIGRTVFRYLCKVTLWNTRSQDFSNVIAELAEVPENVSILDGIAGCSYIEAHTPAVSNDTFEIEVDRSVIINPANMVWNITYETLDGIQQQSYSMNNFDFLPSIMSGDITGDRLTNIDDLAVLANQWLQPPGIPSADIAPQPNGDGFVNFLDFAILAEEWLRH